jgi:hypothetical protein
MAAEEIDKPVAHGRSQFLQWTKLPSELQHAFEEAIAKCNRWQGGDEPTVSYQMRPAGARLRFRTNRDR